MQTPDYLDQETLWLEIIREAEKEMASDNSMASFFRQTILQHDNLLASLAFILAGKFSAESSDVLNSKGIEQTLRSDPAIAESISHDLQAAMQRDSALSLIHI